MRKLLLLCIILVLLNNVLHSQSAYEVQRKQDSLGLYSSKLGGFFDLGINTHSTTNFYGYKLGLPDGGIDELSGTSINIGILYDYPINDKFSIFSRLAYYTYNGNFLTTSNEMTGNDNDPIDTKYEFKFDVNLASLGLEILPTYKIYQGNKLGINFHVGPSFNLMLTNTFTQYEKILTPGVEFQGGKTIKSDSTDKEIQNISSIQLGLAGGLSFDYEISEKFLASFETYYNFGFSKITSVDDWSVNSIRFGIAGKYVGDRPCPPGMTRNAEGQCEELPCAPGQIRNEEGECECRPGMFVNKNGDCEWPPCPERNLRRNEIGECVQFLFADVKAEPILTSGLPAETDVVELKEAESITEQAILNYVFFDEKSASIPSKYVKLTNDDDVVKYSEDKVGDANNILNTYYNVLNIIGYRLSVNPFVSVLLQSYNMGGGESNMPELPDMRIDSVSEYLQKIWKIPDFRIKRQVYNLAPDVARSSDKLLLEEYRRVEFIIDTANMNILKPVRTKNLVLRMNRPRIDFLFDVMPMTKMESWNLKVTQQGKLLHVTNEKVPSDKDNIPEFMSWFAGATANQINPEINKLDYTLEVKDRNGEIANSSKSFGLHYVKFDPERIPEDADSTFRMYYFIFNDKNVSRDVSNISKFLNEVEFDPFNSKMSITGYTDKMGDGNANRLLSDARAREVANYLKEKKKLNLARTSATGRGYVELSDNSKPEGRMYNRLVVLEISTPLKEKEKVEDLVEGCFVLVYSDENELKSKSILDYLIQRGAKDVYIEKYFMASLDKNYYRVRSKAYETPRDAFEVRAKLGIYLRQLNLEKPPSVDCSKKDEK